MKKQPYLQKILEGEIEKTLCSKYFMDFVKFRFEWGSEWVFEASFIGVVKKSGKLAHLTFWLKKEAIESFDPISFLESIEAASLKEGISLKPIERGRTDEGGDLYRTEGRGV